MDGAETPLKASRVGSTLCVDRRHDFSSTNAKENLPATSFSTTVKVLEEMSDRYGRWQDRECHGLKDLLVKLEQAGTGRVLLTSFYGSALHNGTWQFGESKAYLRQLGALDESDPRRLRIIIPNYINSPSNCVASSKFYSVCCIDECENLLGVVERTIGAPEATPKEISAVISQLSSDTVTAPRNLPDSLTSRLTEMATHHKGRIPLHGRLFAQWMHHAYPRECPYPHLSGTTKPLGAIAYVEETGEEAEITHDEIREIISNSKSAVRETDAGEPELPWSSEEELFVYHERPAFAVSTLSAAHQGLVVLAASCSMALGLWRLHQQGSGLSETQKKFHV